MIDELRAEYEKLYGVKPHHKLSEDSLIEAIENFKPNAVQEQETTDAIKDQKAKTLPEVEKEIRQEDQKVKIDTPTRDVIPKYQAEIDRQFAEAEREIAKVKDGKRHLVYKNGIGIWWNPSVIDVYLQRNGPDSLTFPENTQYITDKQIKRCTSCG